MSSGRVFTFYSYKGGVGRTMALANVGALLAQWGHRVLCIDWDLEAPGLDRYLLGRAGRDDSDGLVDLVTALAAGEAPDWHAFVTPVELASGASLDLIHAGRRDKDFLRRMQDIDWERLYAERALGDVIEDMRSAWIDAYDFVLVDSRTGINDVSGICTVQLPDEMVVLFTANSQSFDGVLQVIELAELQRDKLPVDRPRMMILPLISRFELRVEYEEALEWLDEFDQRLRPHLERWISPESVPDAITQLRIPYVPYWSFGERLAVVGRGTHDPDDIGHAYASIAALLATNLIRIDDLRSNRDALINQAQKHALVHEPLNDILLVGEQSDRPFMEDLRAELMERGVRVATWATGTAAEGEIDRIVFETSSNYLFLVGERWSPRRDASIEYALESQEASLEPKRIVPFVRAGALPTELPRDLRRLAVLRESSTVAQSVDAIMSLLDLEPSEQFRSGVLDPDLGWLELDEAFAATVSRLNPSMSVIAQEIRVLTERLPSESQSLMDRAAVLAKTNEIPEPTAKSSAQARRLRKQIQSQLNTLGTFIRVRSRRIRDQRMNLEGLEHRLTELIGKARKVHFIPRHEPSQAAFAELIGPLLGTQESIRGMLNSLEAIPAISTGFGKGQRMLIDELELLLSHFQRMRDIVEGALE